MSQLGKGSVSARLGRAGDNGTVTDRIIKAVRHAPGCQFDDLALSLPDCAWNEVFLEVEHLNQTGQVCVTAKGEGVYTVRLPNKESHRSAQTAGHKSGSFKRSFNSSGGKESSLKREEDRSEESSRQHKRSFVLQSVSGPSPA